MGMAETNKDFDVTAFGEFCAKLEKHKHSTYFEELLLAQRQIMGNIRDDHPPFLGIYVTQADHEAVCKGNHLLQARAEAGRYDVRRLREQAAQLGADMDVARETYETLSTELKTYETLSTELKVVTRLLASGEDAGS